MLTYACSFEQVASWADHKPQCRVASSLRVDKKHEGSDLGIYHSNPDYAGLARATVMHSSTEPNLREALKEKGFCLLIHHTNPDVVMEDGDGELFEMLSDQTVSFIGNDATFTEDYHAKMRRRVGVEEAQRLQATNPNLS